MAENQAVNTYWKNFVFVFDVDWFIGASVIIIFELSLI